MLLALCQGSCYFDPRGVRRARKRKRHEVTQSKSSARPGSARNAGRPLCARYGESWGVLSRITGGRTKQNSASLVSGSNEASPPNLQVAAAATRAAERRASRPAQESQFSSDVRKNVALNLQRLRRLDKLQRLQVGKKCCRYRNWGLSLSTVQISRSRL